MLRVPYDVMCSEFKRVLLKEGFDEASAALGAKLFADASRDGVYTHGLNRFPTYIRAIRSGVVQVDKRAVKVADIGMIERWDGQMGPGNINAYNCMNRAIELAKERGVGVVALGHTNHWMRPGNYGLQAIENDCMAILWTNTCPNMPAWGGKEPKIGNNPMVFAIPYKDKPVMVDVAMSMFSYGKLDKYARDGVECPVDGGFDKEGNLTKDPKAIMETRQVLPMGYWKGSGLSLALDLVASTLAGGTFVRGVGEFGAEASLSQLFIVFDMKALPDREEMIRQIGLSLADIDASTPMKEGRSVHYPGEGMMKTREDNMLNGIIADEGLWQEVLSL